MNAVPERYGCQCSYCAAVVLLVSNERLPASQYSSQVAGKSESHTVAFSAPAEPLKFDSSAGSKPRPDSGPDHGYGGDCLARQRP